MVKKGWIAYPLLRGSINVMGRMTIPHGSPWNWTVVFHSVLFFFYWGKSPSFADVVYGFPSQSNYTLVHLRIIQHIHIHIIGLLGKKLLNIVALKKIVHILYIIGFHISQHVYIYIICIYIYNMYIYNII